MSNTKRSMPAASQFLGLLMIAALATTGVKAAGATEIIPSLGITKSTDTNAGNAQGFGGIALRAPLTPFLKVEGGITYRQDSYLDNAIKVHQWPVSASLWFTPVPALFLGGGVGWYHTTLDYSGIFAAIDNKTTDKAGVHIGGGVDVPLGPKLSLEMSGRYIFMSKDDATIDVPTTFNPDFWNASIGLAIGF